MVVQDAEAPMACEQHRHDIRDKAAAQINGQVDMWLDKY
jgi:hypothetical protein